MSARSRTSSVNCVPCGVRVHLERDGRTPEEPRAVVVYLITVVLATLVRYAV